MSLLSGNSTHAQLSLVPIPIWDHFRSAECTPHTVHLADGTSPLIARITKYTESLMYEGGFGGPVGREVSPRTDGERPVCVGKRHDSQPKLSDRSRHDVTFDSAGPPEYHPLTPPASPPSRKTTRTTNFLDLHLYFISLLFAPVLPLGICESASNSALPEPCPQPERRIDVTSSPALEIAPMNLPQIQDESRDKSNKGYGP